MEHAAFRVERCRYLALPAKHAVEQWQDGGIGANSGRKRIRRRLQIVSLAAEQDQIEWLAQRIGRYGGRLGQVHVAEAAGDDQTGFGELRGAPRPDQKRHVTARLQQATAEIAADGASADDESTHDKLLLPAA